MARSSRYTSNRARALGFASGLEVKVSVQLEEAKIPFEYESEKCKFKYYTKVTNGGVIDKNGEEIPLAKSSKVIQWHNYTCDFMLTKSDGQPMFIETKGYFKGKDRVKHQALKKLYPDVDLRILFQQDGKVSQKTTYSQWAEKQSIEHYCLKLKDKKAGQLIPQGWLDECMK